MNKSIKCAKFSEKVKRADCFGGSHENGSRWNKWTPVVCKNKSYAEQGPISPGPGLSLDRGPDFSHIILFISREIRRLDNI